MGPPTALFRFFVIFIIIFFFLLFNSSAAAPFARLETKQRRETAITKPRGRSFPNSAA